MLPALLFNLYLLAPFFLGGGPRPTALSDSAAPLRVMSMNISTSTAGYSQVVALIEEREPDIVFLSEVREDLVALLQTELAEAYPVLHAVPSRYTLGLAVLARDPGVDVQTMNAGDDAGYRTRRYLRADFSHGGTLVTLVGIHPLPPMRGAWAAGRDRELALMGTVANETDHPFIFLGDLNASPWSHAMRTLLSETDLRYAANGYGIRPTWLLGAPPLGRLLGAPLDHILVSPEWTVVDYTEAGTIGSDHVPLQADLVLRNEEQSSTPAP